MLLLFVPLISFGILLLFCLLAGLLVKFCCLRNAKSSSSVTVGLFHPYCNAGGGGERVLWCAIRAIQIRYPRAECIVYTGDTDATASDIKKKAQERFNIVLPRSVQFIFLKRRGWVEASRYPVLTLLGQSFGSLVLGWEALSSIVPDIYIDTMGYAFTLPLFKYLGGCKVGCYVHYPTISTDMLDRVSERKQTYNNAGFISRSPLLSSFKLSYYKMFAFLYGLAGQCSDVIMVNSTWTKGHILRLWERKDITDVVYPPCDTMEFLKIPVERNERKTIYNIVSIAQFRPEKDHELQIKSFAKFLRDHVPANSNQYRLVLIGSCRNKGDQERVDSLKELCDTLGVSEHVSFELNVSFEELKKCLADATVGLHTMWNEHFGIGVVELMAAGTLTLAHNSGGPKLDIVVDYNDKPTGFLADTEEEYARTLDKILKLCEDEQLDIRLNARESVNRFSEAEFTQHFLDNIECLFEINQQ